jgi:hypothetical protein
MAPRVRRKKGNVVFFSYANILCGSFAVECGRVKDGPRLIRSIWLPRRLDAIAEGKPVPSGYVV